MMSISGRTFEALGEMVYHLVVKGVTFTTTVDEHGDWTITLTGGY